MKMKTQSLDGKAGSEITLDDEIFGAEIRNDLMHRAVTYQLAKRRSGNHKTKTRCEISGTGKKPWAQKGTGRARAGDLKRNIDRGGAVVHGPVVRDHSISLPKKVRIAALKSALSVKASEGKLIILDEAKAKDHKTKPMAQAMKKLEITNALIIGGVEVDVNFARGCANLPRIDVLPTAGLNVYDIIRRDILVLTKDVVNDITKKLKD